MPDVPDAIGAVSVTLRELRALARGIVSLRLRGVAKRNLVWFDKGPAAGLRADRRAVRTRKASVRTRKTR